MINTSTNRTQLIKEFISWQFASILLIVFMMASENLFSVPLYTNTVVSDVGTNGIGSANTSRNVAIAPNGNIYCAFNGTMGIRFAKSTDRGASFSSSVMVSPANAECEIEYGTNGYLYVGWAISSRIWFSRSTDDGATWSTPTNVGPLTGIPPVHLSHYGSYVYILDRLGSTLWVSFKSWGESLI